MIGHAEDASEYVPEGNSLRHDAKGAPITQEYLDRAAREAEEGLDLTRARRVGRPSLGSSGRHSPRVSFRLSEDVRSRAEQVAHREGKTVSQLAREALERYLAS